MTEFESLLREILAEVRNLNAYVQRGQMSLDLIPPSPAQSATAVPILSHLNQTGLFDGLESPEFVDECKPPEPEATREEVIAALNKVALKHGPETGKRVLSQCGVAKLADLPKDKYREVVKTCEAL